VDNSGGPRAVGGISSHNLGGIVWLSRGRAINWRSAVGGRGGVAWSARVGSWAAVGRRGVASWGSAVAGWSTAVARWSTVAASRRSVARDGRGVVDFSGRIGGGSASNKGSGGNGDLHFDGLVLNFNVSVNCEA